MDLKGRRPVDASLLESMRDSMNARGPDECGSYRREGIGLAHRRLSIIDISTGQQPLTTSNGTTTITFNGEIYNYREVRGELEGMGQVFRTNSDTEVILNAWVVWGERCVDRLRGMFAFAIWDEPNESLFLARDRLGIKPLHYSTTSDGFLVFGSEIKALSLFPGVDLSIHASSVEDYFTFGYVPDPKTIYSGIHKLEPGHTLLVLRGKKPLLQQYWDVSPVTDCPNSDTDVQEELLERLTEAVGIRMMAEVPLGAFLSGGVDSSTIVALMSGLSEEPVNTCSIGFSDPAFDESSRASLVAKHFGTNHHTKKVSQDDSSGIDMMAGVYDEPFADDSALPTLTVCELARKHVTVTLSGDGADEVLAGYRRQRLHINEQRVRSLVPHNLRARIFGPLGRAFPKADWAPRQLRAKTTLQALAVDSVTAYLTTVARTSHESRSRLFSSELKSRLNGYNSIDLFRHHAERAPSSDPLDLIQYLDIKTSLVGDILTKVDRASMRHSLEVRVPFLDHEVVNWCFGLAPRHRLSGGVGKRALRGAMNSILPDEILRSPKMGFSVPLASWTRVAMQERAKATLQGDRLRDSGLFDANRLDQILAEHVSRRVDHSSLVWSLMIFDDFLKCSQEAKPA